MQKDVNGEREGGVVWSLERRSRRDERRRHNFFSTSSSLLNGLFKVYVTSEVGLLLGRQSSKVERALLDEEMLVHRL